jgi:hypothetical protein
MAVAFLCTRVQSPDVDDFKKLGRVVSYLKVDPSMKPTLEAKNLHEIRWWVDASFAVHPNMRSHTGGCVSFGRGCFITTSGKQKLNSKSSTIAELIGVSDIIGPVLWLKNFMEAQGYEIRRNIIYQDNMSTMLLEKNGKHSSGKNTRHIDIRYFFITDCIQKGLVMVEYCTTEEMIADFLPSHCK